MNDEKPKDLGTYFLFWDKLTENEKVLLQSNIITKKYKQGESIHNGDNDCIGIFSVKCGSLRTYILSDEGKEITLYRLYKGDVCILSAPCVLRDITFDVHITAEENCEILLINSIVFSQLLKQNIYVENYAYKIATDRFSEVMWAMQQILFMSFDKRLAIFLMDETAKTGSDIINLTHEQIAKYIGSAREVVTRMLKNFSNEGIVELSRGNIRIIDKNKLRSLT